MEMRTTCTITLLSVAATFFVIFHAFYQKNQFYPSVVYLTKSNTSLAVLYAQALVFVYLFAQLVRKIFFGQLRAVESEHLSERAWYAVTETCLAFTVFRDDFSPRFVAHFTLLLVLKCFHWLAEERVDYMERSPLITILFHCRLMSVIAFLSTLDSYFMSHAYFTTLLRGASVQIVFGFEYAILMTIIFHIAVKYILHSIDSRNVHPWENKAVYLLYAELVIGLMRVVLYTVFVLVMIRLHTFPLFSIRPMYLTLRSFKKALNDIFMSRRAINYLNNLFPNATDEELSNTDTVCIICREEMTRGQAKKLPCNHIFHAACLRSWFQRQQTCPTCRMDIIQAANNVLLTTQGVNQRPAANGPTPPGQTNVNPNAQQQQQGQNQPNPLQANLAGFPGFPQNMAQMPPGFNPFGFMGPALGAGPMGGQGPGAGHVTGQQAAPGGQTTTGGDGYPAGPGPFNPVPGMGQYFPPPPFIGGMPMPPFSTAPPFQFPFALPFPAPPNFAGFTDDEVRQMEQTSRNGVESRVQALRNIQTLLDAAVVQLQQYLSLMPIAAAASALGGPLGPFPTPSDSNPVNENAQSRTTEPSQSTSGPSQTPANNVESKTDKNLHTAAIGDSASKNGTQQTVTDQPGPSSGNPAGSSGGLSTATTTTPSTG